MDNELKTKENSNQGKKIKTYSQRMKSFSKINTFYFALKQKRGKRGYRKLNLEHG